MARLGEAEAEAVVVVDGETRREDYSAVAGREGVGRRGTGRGGETREERVGRREAREDTGEAGRGTGVRREGAFPPREGHEVVGVVSPPAAFVPDRAALCSPMGAAGGQ